MGPTGAVPARGQTRATSPGSLAAYAPSDCGVFIQIERPENINPNLRNANAWKLLQLMLGAEIGPADDSSDWYDILVSNLAGESTAAMRELFSERAALVAPTWTELADGVILIQIPNRAALRRLVGPGRVKSEAQQGGLRIYETTRGLLIATDGRTVIISQQQAPSELFSGCLDLLRGKSKDSLRNTPRFSARVKELPKRVIPQGFFYFSTVVRHATSGPATEPTSAPAREAEVAVLWPGVRAGVVGMYVYGSRVDFVLRATPAEAPNRTCPRVDMRWVKHLPRSTLAVWATSLDVDAAFERFVSAPSDSAVTLYAGFLTRALNPEQLKRDVVSKIGPRVMCVWGHDFVVEQGSSSLGLLLESTDADAVKSALDVAVSELVEAVNTGGVPDDENQLRVTTEEISGAEVTVIELADYLAAKPLTSVAPRLLSTMRLCYTALDDWLLVAWNVNHMRELIAAHQGTQPMLGEFTDVGRLALRRGPTVLGVGQLATAAAVLGEWLDETEKQPDSILNLYARGIEGVTGEHGRWLGLGLGPQTRPGRAPVTIVYEDGPCHGLLESGDDILAIDGEVLDLEDANGALRERVRALADGQTVALRLEHEGVLVDVHVVVNRPRSPREKAVADAVCALRRLQALSRHLAFATFSVTRSNVESYHAHLRLRFSDNR